MLALIALALASCGEFPRGGSERALIAPSHLDTESKCVVTNTGYSRPLSKMPTYTIQGQPDVIWTVASLLYFGCPTTIFGSVVSKAIDSINSVKLGGPLSHVNKETKIIQPLVADCNADSAPTGIATRVFVVAAPLHGLPGFVGQRTNATMLSRKREHLPSQASTALGVSVLETSGTNNFFRATRTTTKPAALSSGRLGRCRQDDKPSVDAADIHGNYYIMRHREIARE